MNALFPTEIKKIEITPEYWVKVYTSFSVERAALFKKGQDLGDDAYCALACISSWNFKDDEDKDVDRTVENLRSMKKSICNKIILDTLGVNEEVKKETKKAKENSKKKSEEQKNLPITESQQKAEEAKKKDTMS